MPRPAGVIGRAGRPAADRFDIHRNNIFASLTAALRARFPVVVRLVGEAFFADMAAIFIRRHPPVSPVIMEYGGAFAAFLKEFDAVGALPYLADIARLEWLRHLAAHGADAVPADLSPLARLAPSAMAELRFTLHPTATALSSAYPVASIWRANAVAPDLQPVLADSAGESVLIVRPHRQVLLLDLPPAGDVLIAALQEGRTLGDAAALAAARDLDFDLTLTLAALFRGGAITGFAPGHSSSN
ncbi:MAG: putative DNA-binding domain-containing protein [Rhodospirillaceae bacterium]|nr:putative DNA-binding domain-containing protein [Rhodospirillaceae bacterium]